jgi:hypothetical protein
MAGALLCSRRAPQPQILRVGRPSPPRVVRLPMAMEIAVGRFVLTIAALCAFPFAGIAHAQDVVKVAPEHNKIILENADVRVSKTLLPPAKKMRCTHILPAGITSPNQGR